MRGSKHNLLNRRSRLTTSPASFQLELSERYTVSQLRSRIEKIFFVTSEKPVEVLIYFLLRITNNGIHRLNLQAFGTTQTISIIEHVEYNVDDVALALRSSGVREAVALFAGYWRAQLNASVPTDYDLNTEGSSIQLAS
ncbi:hypothetical protein [Haliea sp.]|uniref:hypothetical protein n=1 Tax=Haliea sp. TaxID=1932666 RepID=UPI003526D2D3